VDVGKESGKVAGAEQTGQLVELIIEATEQGKVWGNVAPLGNDVIRHGGISFGLGSAG
jgi:hypothetical protein